MVRMSHFCRQWRLKPSASKTISSVFHLHNTSATRKLSVYISDCIPGISARKYWLCAPADESVATPVPPPKKNENPKTATASETQVYCDNITSDYTCKRIGTFAVAEKSCATFR